MSRGLRNNNPGNIRLSGVTYKGEVTPSRDRAFKTFESAAWGYRAMFMLLHTYEVKHGITTLRGMISRWAPPSENDTESYIKAVAQRAGITPDTRLHTMLRGDMVPVVAAMSRVENGVNAVMGDVNEGWNLYITK